MRRTRISDDEQLALFELAASDDSGQFHMTQDLHRALLSLVRYVKVVHGNGSTTSRREELSDLPVVIAAVIATEVRRRLSNPGLGVRRFMRITTVDITRGGGVTEGGRYY